MKKFFFNTGKVVSYLIAIVIIGIALLVSVGRFVTPVLTTHRADFEKWTGELLHMPVKIDGIRVTWYRYQPEITFDQVTILNRETLSPIFKIQQARVFFSLWHSLLEHKLVPDAILIKGTDVNLEEQPSGEVAIQGFATRNQFQGDLLHQITLTDMLGWLSLPPHLLLEDIAINYQLSRGKAGFVLTIENFNLQNQGSQHALAGNVILQQAIPTTLTFSAQWRGDITMPAQVQANLYLYVEGASLPQWLNGKTLDGWQLKRGLGSAKVWANWDKGTWSKIQSYFTLYSLSLYSQTDKSTHVINRLSGDIGWKQEGQTQVLAGDDILIDLPSHLLPLSRFYLILTPNTQGHWAPKALRLGYVDLGDVQSFLFSSASFPANVKAMLAKLHMDGVLEEASINFPAIWDDFANTDIVARFHDLDFSAVNAFPGVSNVSGRLEWKGASGSLALDSRQTVFTYPSIFTNPLTLAQVKGELNVETNPEGAWLVHIPALHLANQDLWADIHGLLTLPIRGSPVADIAADFELNRANRVTDYLPMKKLDKELVHWLESAFLTGSVTTGTAVLQGVLADFPFAQGNGKFLIGGQLKDIDFRYDSDWPLIRHMNGAITFSGPSMTADIRSGETLEIPITAVHGVIPYLGTDHPTILEVQGSINTDLRQGLRFIQGSPLGGTIGKALAGVELNGPANLALSLTIPLANPALSKILGVVNMSNATLLAPQWRVSLGGMSGIFNFTESGITAEQIKGNLLDEPVTLSLTTISSAKQTSYVKAQLSGKLSIDDLQRWLDMSLSTVAQGATDYQAELDLSADAPLKIILQSNLQGIALTLPAPYAKTAEETRAFQATVIAQQPIQMRLDYANLLSTAISFQKTAKGLQFVNGELHLGAGIASWPHTPGWHITGIFEELNWNDIQAYWQPSKLPLQLSTLNSIDIQAKSLTIFGQHLHQPHIQVVPMGRVWDVSISSDEVKGKLHVPQQFTAKSHIDAQFQRLHLQSNPDDKASSGIDPRSVPSLSLSGDDLRYEQIQLGHITLTTQPSASGLSIKELHLSSPYWDLDANGSWAYASGQGLSSLTGHMHSSQMSKLLQQWGVDTHNVALSTSDINFNFNWPDAPYHLALAGLSGKVGLKFGKGRLLDSETGGAQMGIGRMLSLFSLQTLPRRLSFDFSDLFEQGYSFDSVKGDLTLRNGDALTDNIKFDGPVARVRVAGRIGLKRKDYDLKLEVTPYVTSSIPVAATLLTGQPVIGIAAWLVNKVISSQVSKVASHVYTVTGPWDKPEWHPASAK